MKFVIGELFRPNCALDQVNSWQGSGTKSIHCCPEPPANTVTMNRIRDLSAYCVGHTQG